MNEASSLRLALRGATAPHHQEVDALFSVFALETHQGYRAFLRAHAQAVWPLELALEAAGVARLLPDWPQRRRRFALAQDLRRLGLVVPAPLDYRCADAAACWGTLYTLEGSRLGGALLARRVAGMPELTAASAYLTHGAGQPLWPTFLGQLEGTAGRMPLAALCEAACRAFECFARAGRLAAQEMVDNADARLARSIP
ncbi:biliverdin-producing heme oxygenase [Chitiniphilus purpureus]|uniref:Biliverdin-producing heme oxygenase n=1 Tax=Chitiniphilus purpureus TaxID=2981137 RepID=A0ABY6DQL3_9NEIS|nr:biliverdin-producing heme oxygenase [Chitiniphilus sp. CD1]UXY15381.1 biliverdin-producing heme oxygenase [Chitiniphilus sp. CD1]